MQNQNRQGGEDDAAVSMEGEIMSQGGDGEQSRMAGGGAGQHTTGTSKEMTQEGPDIAFADEGPQIPSVSTNDTLANNLANSSLGARAEMMQQLQWRARS